jgi:hypothetical protein
MPLPTNPEVLTHKETAHLRQAAIAAKRKLPPAIAKQLHEDILDWVEFGYRFGAYKQIKAVADEIVAMPDILERPTSFPLPQTG